MPCATFNATAADERRNCRARSGSQRLMRPMRGATSSTKDRRSPPGLDHAKHARTLEQLERAPIPFSHSPLPPSPTHPFLFLLLPLTPSSFSFSHLPIPFPFSPLPLSRSPFPFFIPPFPGSMTVTEALHARTSIREFLDTPLPESKVREILDVARWAPSGGNLQPWKVIAVAGDERRAVTELAKRVLMDNPGGEASDFPVYPEKLWEPYRSRRYDLGEAMYELLEIPREDKMARLMRFARNYEFFG